MKTNDRTFRTIVLAGVSSERERAVRSTGHSELKASAAVIQSLQNVCVQVLVAVGFVKGMLVVSS